MEQRYRILVISGDNYFRKEVVAFDMEYNNAVITFLNNDRDVIAIYPTSRTIVESIDNLEDK
jgi:hypothetical protein